MKSKPKTFGEHNVIKAVAKPYRQLSVFVKRGDRVES